MVSELKVFFSFSQGKFVSCLIKQNFSFLWMQNFSRTKSRFLDLVIIFESPELSLLVQNKEKDTASISITTPKFVKLEHNKIELQGKENKKAANIEGEASILFGTSTTSRQNNTATSTLNNTPLIETLQPLLV
ncbi:uncharacterized protein LOC129892882 [Solanum dulcamara]|uniref:uncharacterized protein LOC129892882 n=1 Tax=Solanum dulcamara TaxID=45834 RepID=UPI0024858069|nr:uncharacterized protein LOC129892882 [Solanum dulcamara]